MSLDPTSDFAKVPLELLQVGIRETYGRIFPSYYPDPLGFGKGATRFSDSRPLPDADRFGVLYLGETLKTCFVEALLRDQRDGIVGQLPIEERELHDRIYAEIGFRGPLLMADLRDESRLRMGIPSDVTKAADQRLGRSWASAIYVHPDRPDGIIYGSRINGQTNLAVFDRAIGRLECRSQRPLIQSKGLASVLNDLLVQVI